VTLLVQDKKERKKEKEGRKTTGKRPNRENRKKEKKKGEHFTVVPLVGENVSIYAVVVGSSDEDEKKIQ